MATILTHAADARALYYGDEALARLRELGEVRLNETGGALSTPQLIELAGGCQIIVSIASPRAGGGVRAAARPGRLRALRGRHPQR